MIRILLALACALPLAATAERIVVVRVIDGDTIVARIDGRIERIRLAEIDAPEMSGEKECERSAAQAAKHALAGLLAHVEIEAHTRGRDRYGRILATLRLPDGTDAGTWMMERGHARPYRQRMRGRWC